MGRNNYHGNIAVWILIFAEMTEFAFFFVAFLVIRHYFPTEFQQGPQQLNTNIGFYNSIILLSSSCTVAFAQTTFQKGEMAKCKCWLLFTMVLGLCYCANKYFEYEWNQRNGISIQKNYFFSIYYYLTFNHLLHVLIGMTALLISYLSVVIGIIRAPKSEGLEGSILYWHMVDLAWIIIFPALYVLN